MMSSDRPETAAGATAPGESSENVRAYSATPKELEVRNKFASTESHNRLGNDDPDLVGIFRGMGTEDRGRALAEREPAPTLQRHERVGQTVGSMAAVEFTILGLGMLLGIVSLVALR